MRDLVSCFSENSINVTNPSCSNYSSNACISPALSPSVQTSITSIYRITIGSSSSSSSSPSSSRKHLLINVTWCKNNTNPANQGLSIGVFAHDNNPSTCLKLNTNSRFFRKKKGSKVLESDLGKIEVLWDLSSAKYDNLGGPEPVEGFYVIVLVDAELGLVLGASAEEALFKKLIKCSSGDFSSAIAKNCLVSRQEHFSGNTLYSTRAKFAETGISHEILIRCSGETEGLKQNAHDDNQHRNHGNHHHHPVLSVCIDKKTVIKVKRLQWNFRGNQTIFVDGLLVDLMWDVHDWFFSSNQGSSSSGSGKAVFMFRTRSGMDSRLWLEEKMMKKEQNNLDFSLLIYACKT
ncbi:PREDICTED: uncharacterized protein LOC104800552 [Tarenaya hassleriana]|uniref:uncharacterized protein LOC104800552 n=1 Tax=Tarenaya hassleriana TaxID=28532 RepID=UPI00053CA036|nr:PREDICTED: uncharacterized protein LOC104800552 [Tarenaya hassleriana]